MFILGVERLERRLLTVARHTQGSENRLCPSLNSFEVSHMGLRDC